MFFSCSVKTSTVTVKRGPYKLRTGYPGQGSNNHLPDFSFISLISESETNVLLVSLLAHKVSMVDTNANLMSDKKVRLSQWQSTVSMQAKLNKYWEEYQAVYMMRSSRRLSE